MLTACADHTEVRDRTFISTVAVTQDLDEFFVTVTDDKGKYTGSGETILLALKKAEENSGKNMFFGHTELLCVNINNLETNLLTLVKSNYFSPNTLLCTSKNNDLISEETTAKIENNSNNGYLKAMTISDTLQDLLSQGKAKVPFITKGNISMKYLF